MCIRDRGRMADEQETDSSALGFREPPLEITRACLSYMGRIMELRKWVFSRTGIDLFKSDEIFEVALLATEVRNLIAHNDCMANETIMDRIGESSSKLDISELGKV